jgi:hypothetical protein
VRERKKKQNKTTENITLRSKQTDNRQGEKDEKEKVWADQRNER